MNTTANPKEWHATGLVYSGFLTLVVLVGGIGSWAYFAQLAGAIVATGVIEVESNRQIVQHPEGGIVSEILVDDGDLVKAGDVLLRLDDTLLRSELAIVEGQLFEHMARSARLSAERDNSVAVVFSDELIAIAEDRPTVQDIMDGQLRLFAARNTALIEEAASLQEQINQVYERITGLKAKMLAIKRQRELIQAELTDQLALLASRLTQISQVRGLQREEASLSGQIGELNAIMAQVRGQIAAFEIEIVRLNSETRETAITTLRDLRYNEVELRERRSALLERLSRFDIRAPRSGVIYGLQVQAVRSVVVKAEALLFIVPQDTSLIVTTRIAASDIDQVDIGQSGILRFSAFDTRTTPELNGKVTKISADVFTDEAAGTTFFVIELVPTDGEIVKLEGRALLPGMPVEVFFRTEVRSPWQYIINPLAGYFNRALRES